MDKNENKATEEKMNGNSGEVPSQDLDVNESGNTQENAQTDEKSEEGHELTHEEELEQKLAASETKIEELQDKYLRQVAEFDNYRKRTMKEKAEIIRNGGEKTITEILPILDDFERALKTMETAEDVASVSEGVNLIFQKFIKILQQQGLKSIETEGADFNVDYHEAIALVPAPSDDQKGKILDCVQTGYMLNDKVIRHAKVAVAQ